MKRTTSTSGHSYAELDREHLHTRQHFSRPWLAYFVLHLQQYFRCYSPVAFGKKTDKNGDYIRKYLPVLRNFPSKYIYEPWTAPFQVSYNECGFFFLQKCSVLRVPVVRVKLRVNGMHFWPSTATVFLHVGDMSCDPCPRHLLYSVPCVDDSPIDVLLRSICRAEV